MSERVTEASLLFLSGVTFLYLSIELLNTDIRMSLVLSLVAIVLILPMLLLVGVGIRKMALIDRSYQNGSESE